MKMLNIACEVYGAAVNPAWNHVPRRAGAAMAASER
jgi:hypothetical protein